MMKMLETQVGQLAGRLSANEGKLPGQPQGPEMVKAIQTRLGKVPKIRSVPREQESLNHPPRQRNFLRRRLPRSSLKSPSLRCLEKTWRYRKLSHATSEVNLIIILRSLWRLRRLSINMPHRNKYEIATLGVDHVKISEQCRAAIAMD
jgi:hypothetical protein